MRHRVPDGRLFVRCVYMGGRRPVRSCIVARREVGGLGGCLHAQWPWRRTDGEGKMGGCRTACRTDGYLRDVYTCVDGGRCDRAL